METEITLQRLNEVCMELARTTMWARKPVDVDNIHDLATRYTEIAMQQVKHGSELGIDIPLVTRAVCYLHQAHAIPPMATDEEWFDNMLQAVLELARPNSGLTGEGRQFLRDLLFGIGTFFNDEELDC